MINNEQCVHLSFLFFFNQSLKDVNIKNINED